MFLITFIPAAISVVVLLNMTSTIANIFALILIAIESGFCYNEYIKPSLERKKHALALQESKKRIEESEEVIAYLKGKQND